MSKTKEISKTKEELIPDLPITDNKIWQEMYCNECDGFFRVKLNISLNIRIKMICPNCGHQHTRCIKDGKILEIANVNGREEEIYPPKSAYSKEPFTKKMKKHARDGVIIGSKEDLSKEIIADNFVKERWYEIWGGNS